MNSQSLSPHNSSSQAVKHRPKLGGMLSALKFLKDCVSVLNETGGNLNVNTDEQIYTLYSDNQP